jgi:nitrous oxidase accessory protein NosD
MNKLRIALLALPLAFAAPAQADTVVGPAGSIQAAVDAAAPGATIVVRGTHRENVAVGTDGITLRGLGAVLEPPATPAANACFDPSAQGESVHGICVSGDIDFETGEIARHVERVSVTGFTVRGFTGNGITTAAANDVTIAGNVVERNGDGGLAAIASSGVRMRANRTAGNRFGVYIGGSLAGSITGDSIHDNCIGVFVLGQPLPAGRYRIAGNDIRRNTRACPAAGDWPALSGAGVALIGASDNAIVANAITGNAPSGPTVFSGGVAVLSEPGGIAAERNIVAGNLIAGNDPDIFWDHAGAGNVFGGADSPIAGWRTDRAIGARHRSR